LWWLALEETFNSTWPSTGVAIEEANAGSARLRGMGARFAVALTDATKARNAVALARDELEKHLIEHRCGKF
jgi:hypothetical protein